MYAQIAAAIASCVALAGAALYFSQPSKPTRSKELVDNIEGGEESPDVPISDIMALPEIAEIAQNMSPEEVGQLTEMMELIFSLSEDEFKQLMAAASLEEANLEAMFANPDLQATPPAEVTEADVSSSALGSDAHPDEEGVAPQAGDAEKASTETKDVKEASTESAVLPIETGEPALKENSSTLFHA